VVAVKYRPFGTPGASRCTSSELWPGHRLFGIHRSGQRRNVGCCLSGNTSGVGAFVRDSAGIRCRRNIHRADRSLLFHGIAGPVGASAGAGNDRLYYYTAREAGKSVGIFVPDIIEAKAYISRGVQYLTTSDQSLLIRAGRECVGRLLSLRSSQVCATPSK
jgi:hypothetical protein